MYVQVGDRTVHWNVKSDYNQHTMAVYREVFQWSMISFMLKNGKISNWNSKMYYLGSFIITNAVIRAAQTFTFKECEKKK